MVEKFRWSNHWFWVLLRWVRWQGWWALGGAVYAPSFAEFVVPEPTPTTAEDFNF